MLSIFITRPIYMNKVQVFCVDFLFHTIDLLHNYVSSLEIHLETTLVSTWCVAKSQSMHCFQTHKAIPFISRSNARFGNRLHIMSKLRLFQDEFLERWRNWERDLFCKHDNRNTNNPSPNRNNFLMIFRGFSNHWRSCWKISLQLILPSWINAILPAKHPIPLCIAWSLQWIFGMIFPRFL